MGWGFKLTAAKIATALGFTPENAANKNAAGGYVGKTGQQINFRNLTNTFTSFLQNAATAVRTYSFQDRDGIVVDASNASPGYFGLYPMATFPVARTLNSANGNNDLYTAPAGRKALVLEYMVTNSTAGGINHQPSIKISGTYYKIGISANEPAAGVGHNYGMGSTKNSQAIVLNPGESFSVSADAVGLTIWAFIIEFDSTSPLKRADITAWAAGNNTLYTVGAGKTLQMGTTSLGGQNSPAVSLNAVAYFNNSGANRTMGGFYAVPNAGAAGVTNQWAGSNVLVTGQGFTKWFFGGLGAGDFIVINSDANTAGQYAWMNYIEN